MKEQERTPEELKELRAKTIKGLNLDPDVEFGCDGCNVAFRCLYAYHEYNVDGFCKASEDNNV